MKVNPPTVRGKIRYILFRVHSENPLDYYNLKDSVFYSLLDFLGENGTAKANAGFVKNLWDLGKQTGVVKCSPKYVDLVKLSLSMVHQVGDEKVVLQTLKVSGTIKGLGKNK